jgi:hypothetical protein
MATLYNQQNTIGAPNFDLSHYQSWPQQQSTQSTPECFFEPSPFSPQVNADMSTLLFPTSDMYFDSTSPVTRQPNFTSSSLSPHEIPLSPPIPTNTRKRRASTTASWQPMAFRPHKPYRPRPTEPSPKLQPKKIKTDNSPLQVEASPTVGQLETELAFLNDDCSTIMMMLDSLRNAFSTGPSLVVNGMATLDFSKDDKKRAKARNPEMERELRSGYDDLMIQVRQLEKKVERLETLQSGH